MENLPPELLAKVVQNLPRNDLPRLRFISRTLAAVVAPFVFSTISLWIDLKSLEALTSISEDPRLSTYVKTIAFSPFRFMEPEDHKICDRQLRDTLEFQPGSSSSHINHLEKHMAGYDIAGQRYLASGSLDVKILSQALSKLPRFKSLILDYEFHGRTLRLYQVFGGRGGNPGMVTMDGDYSLPVLFTALSNAKVAITALTIRDSSEGSFCSNDSSIRLPGFEEGNIPPTASYEAVAKALGETFYPPHNHVCRAALRELRQFEVDIGNEDDVEDPFCYAAEYNGEFSNIMRDILKWSPQLESIRIAQTTENFLWLMKCFPTQGLAKLRKVHLCEFRTDLSDLLLFFQCHGRGLKDVHLDSVRVDNANWAIALDRLRSLEFPDLEIFSLFSCRLSSHDTGNVENACDYIKGATDINPLY